MHTRTLTIVAVLFIAVSLCALKIVDTRKVVESWQPAISKTSDPLVDKFAERASQRRVEEQLAYIRIASLAMLIVGAAIIAFKTYTVAGPAKWNLVAGFMLTIFGACCLLIRGVGDSFGLSPRATPFIGTLAVVFGSGMVVFGLLRGRQIGGA